MSTCCVTCLRPGAKLRPATKWGDGQLQPILQCDQCWQDWLDFAESFRANDPPKGWTEIIA